MKKPSFIVGKKQIILACLTLILGVAVYINYAVTPAENLTPKASQSLEAIGGDEKTENYGDTKFVNGEDLTQNKAEEENNTAENVVSEAGNIVEEQPEQQVDEQGDMSAEEYFSQARLEKMTSHDNAVQTLQTIMGGGYLTEDENGVALDVTFENGGVEVYGSTVPEYKLGDVNMDGALTVADAVTVLQACAQVTAGGESPLTDQQKKLADMNQDGNVSVGDAVDILVTIAQSMVG